MINNNITVHVQQIAATRQQIEKKAVDIAQFLNGFQPRVDPANVRHRLAREARADAVRLAGFKAEPIRVRVGGGFRPRRRL